MKKLFFILSLMFIASHWSLAQNRVLIDSLKFVLEQSPDTSKVNVMMRLADQYMFSPDSAMIYANKAYALAEELNDARGMILGLAYRGRIHEHVGNYDKALQLYLEGLRLARLTKLKAEQKDILTDLAIVYKVRGDYPKALEYNLQSLQISEQLKNKKGVAVSLTNIGNVHSAQGEFDQGLEYYQKAIAILDSLGEKGPMARLLNNIGIIYNIKQDFDQSMDYHLKSLEIREELGDKDGMATSYNNIGDMLVKKGEHYYAEQYLKKSLKIYQETDNQDKLPFVYLDLAKMYKDSDLAKASYYARKGLEIAERTGRIAEAETIHFLLADIYDQSGQYKLAVAHLGAGGMLKDSLYNREKSRQIAEVRTRYEVEKIGREMALQKQKIALLESDQQIKTLWRNIMGVGLLVTTLFGVMVYLWQRTRLRKNKQLFKTRQELVKVELENAKLKEKELEQALEFKNKELASYTLNFIQKGELMEELKENIQEIKSKGGEDISKKLNNLNKLVDSTFHLDKDWEDFRLHFEQIHKDFFIVLLERFPELSSNELKLCTLIKLNMNLKEASNFLGISPDSVKKARYRLRKKLALTKEDSLVEFMINMEKREQAVA